MHHLPELPLFYGVEDSVLEIAFHEPDLRSTPPESLTQSIWEQGRFARGDAATVDGQLIRIIQPGKWNRDGGPDFLGARIVIGDVQWTGDVELHNASGQWFDHGHDTDPRYDSVILHVTLRPDMWTGKLTRSDGTIIPELVLHPLLEAPMRSLLFDHLSEERRSIPCSAGWRSVPEPVTRETIRAMGRMRLKQMLDSAPGITKESDIEQHLYERIMVALGFAKNSEPMLDVARRLPLRRARGLDLDSLEAAYLGTAGLLPEPGDLLKADRQTADHVMSLRETFHRLMHRENLVPLSPNRWQFFRLRPANFPTVRLAQAAAYVSPGGLLHRSPLSKLMDAVHEDEPIRALRNALGVCLPLFWSNHVRLDRASRTGAADIGRERIDQIILNAVIPTLMILSRMMRNRTLPERLLEIASGLPAESTEITRLFNQLGTPARNALETQGMRELYRTRCGQYQCLSCPIGQRLLRPFPRQA